MDKRGTAGGEFVIMIPRILLISLTAFIVFGVGSVVYDYELYVRDVESTILVRSIYDCLAHRTTLNLDFVPEEDRDSIMDYCGFENTDRYYVGAYIYDPEGENYINLSQGRKDDLWVKKYYNSLGKKNRARETAPGYSIFGGPLHFIDGETTFDGELIVEVLVKNEG